MSLILGEEEKSRLEQRIEAVRGERDACQSEAENLKVQLHLTEDKYESINNQLHETIRKLKESKLFLISINASSGAQVIIVFLGITDLFYIEYAHPVIFILNSLNSTMDN